MSLHHCPCAGVLPEYVWHGNLALKTGIAVAARGQAQECGSIIHGTWMQLSILLGFSSY